MAKLVLLCTAALVGFVSANGSECIGYRGNLDCSGDENCRACHSNGCDQCNSGYWKLNYNSECVTCDVEGCKFCRDFDGCGQCKPGWTLSKNECGYYVCVNPPVSYCENTVGKWKQCGGRAYSGDNCCTDSSIDCVNSSGQPCNHDRDDGDWWCSCTTPVPAAPARPAPSPATVAKPTTPNPDTPVEAPAPAEIPSGTDLNNGVTPPLPVPVVPTVQTIPTVFVPAVDICMWDIKRLQEDLAYYYENCGGASTTPPADSCVLHWRQCGGASYDGPVECCKPTDECVFLSEDKSICRPPLPARAPTPVPAVTPKPVNGIDLPVPNIAHVYPVAVPPATPPTSTPTKPVTTPTTPITPVTTPATTPTTPATTPTTPKTPVTPATTPGITPATTPTAPATTPGTTPVTTPTKPVTPATPVTTPTKPIVAAPQAPGGAKAPPSGSGGNQKDCSDHDVIGAPSDPLCPHVNFRDSKDCYCDEHCKVCHSNGCDQCSNNSWKLDYDYWCVECTIPGCKFCQDNIGCGQCNAGYRRVMSSTCGYFVCESVV